MRKKRRPAPKETAENPGRRSPCPVSCALDLFGDRWTLLVIRDLFLGRNRFKEFASSPEGIPTNILSDRLTKLMGAGLICQTRVEEGGKRMAYKLTDKGKDLEPVLEAVRQWSLQWQPGTKVLLHQK